MEKHIKQDSSLGYRPEEYQRFRRYGLWLLILFSLFYAALYCTRLNLANAGAKMMEELSLTSGQIGVLTACLFWGYAAGNLLGGRWTELLGAKLIGQDMMDRCGTLDCEWFCTGTELARGLRDDRELVAQRAPGLCDRLCQCLCRLRAGDGDGVSGCSVPAVPGPGLAQRVLGTCGLSSCVSCRFCAVYPGIPESGGPSGIPGRGFRAS